MPLIVPAGTRSFFAARRFAHVVELAAGESHQIGPLAVTATPADHEIGRRGIDAAPVGFLVEGSRRVYFAGDTDLFDGMAVLHPSELEWQAGEVVGAESINRILRGWLAD